MIENSPRNCLQVWLDLSAFTFCLKVEKNVSEKQGNDCFKRAKMSQNVLKNDKNGQSGQKYTNSQKIAQNLSLNHFGNCPKREAASKIAPKCHKMIEIFCDKQTKSGRKTRKSSRNRFNLRKAKGAEKQFNHSMELEDQVRAKGGIQKTP